MVVLFVVLVLLVFGFCTKSLRELTVSLEVSGTCSVHGTLKRHVSSGIDTTMEEDIFDDYSGSLTGEVKTNGGLAFPFQTADMMLKGGKMRSRAGSLSSPSHLPPPRLGVSGLYTDHLERRKYTMDPPGLSPPVRNQSESSRQANEKNKNDQGISRITNLVKYDFLF